MLTGLAILVHRGFDARAGAFIAWRHNVETRLISAGAWSFMLSGIGFGMVALRAYIPSYLSIETGNTIAALFGQSAWVAGYLALDRRKIEWWVLPPAGLAGRRVLPWSATTIRTGSPSTISLRQPARTALTIGGELARPQQESARAKLAVMFILQAASVSWQRARSRCCRPTI